MMELTRKRFHVAWRQDRRTLPLEISFVTKGDYFATAILDDAEKMVGSMLVGDFADRAALDKWLEVEPYVTQNVWKKIEIQLCKVGPSFAKK